MTTPFDQEATPEKMKEQLTEALNVSYDERRMLRRTWALTFTPGRFLDSWVGAEIQPLGTAALLTLNSQVSGDGTSRELYALRVYGLALRDGEVVANNRAAFDVRSPAMDPSRRPQTVDNAIQLVNSWRAGTQSPRGLSLPLPRVLIGFDAHKAVQFAETPQLQKLAVAALRSRTFLRLPAMFAPVTGKITEIHDVGNGLRDIFFKPTDGAEVRVSLPAEAVWIVEAGDKVDEGDRLIDITDQTKHRNWRSVCTRKSASFCKWLLWAVWQCAHEDVTQHHALRSYGTGIRFYDHRLVGPQLRAGLQPDVLLEDFRRVVGIQVPNPAKELDISPEEMENPDVLADFREEVLETTGIHPSLLAQKDVEAAIQQPDRPLWVRGVCPIVVQPLHGYPAPETMTLSEDGYTLNLFEVQPQWRDKFVPPTAIAAKPLANYMQLQQAFAASEAHVGGAEFVVAFFTELEKQRVRMRDGDKGRLTLLGQNERSGEAQEFILTLLERMETTCQS